MKTREIGLALSGGTAKSVAHIGVIKALQEHDIGISCITGTSGGSIVAVLFAAGKTVDDLIHLAEGMRWRDLAGLTLPKLGLLSSEKIRKFITDELGDISFSDLGIPAAVVAADVTTGEKWVFRDGKVGVACQASSSIPEIYCPVELDGHIIVDGGLIEYLPVETLSEFGDMFRIGVNLGKREGFRKSPRHLLEVVMQVTGFVAQQNARVSEELADFVIHPDVERFSPFALKEATNIIAEGYDATVKSIPALLRAIGKFYSITERLKRRFQKRGSRGRKSMKSVTR